MIRALAALAIAWISLPLPIDGVGSALALELVETWPVETSLDNSDIRDAHEVWIEMIDRATTSLDFAHFYASNAPENQRGAADSEGRLELVIRAVERAAGRGVHVRFLAEMKFYETYPGTLDRLDARNNIELRVWDTAGDLGGVLHAKYFLVDADPRSETSEWYLGSQNFDWRALAHIVELGVSGTSPRGRYTTGALRCIFDQDWARAGDEALPPPPLDGNRHSHSVTTDRMVDAADSPRSDEEQVSYAFSPKDALCAEETWDLPQLLEMIDGAQERIRVQLLSYSTKARDGSYWDDLDSALRRAANRGVQVELLLSHWCKRPGTIQVLQSLQPIPNITVKLATIPEWSGGYIPFARVIHSKYMVVDGRKSWIGTSNWEKSYFYTSRNVGLVVESPFLGQQLDEYFLSLWDSEYVETVDPAKQYERPVYGEK